MDSLFTLSPLLVGAVPVVVGLVQVAKSSGLPSRLAPLASLAVGAGLVALTGATWQETIARGAIVGLAASGLWSGGKAIGSKKSGDDSSGT